MRRVLWSAFALATSPSLAVASPTYVSGFFGPRLFSDDTALGFLPDERYHPSLRNGIGLGARLSKPVLFPWLVPELELAFAPTRTTEEGGAASASVTWLMPRMHLRIDLLPERRVEPFLVFGGGAPIALSTARRTFDSGVTGEGYLGAGVRFQTYRGFALRFDARVSVQPGGENPLAVEGDISIGVEFGFGVPRRARAEELVASAAPDRDQDGFPDATDRCPDRPEDVDDFEDGDGCPEIDNDEDRVLDIADKCQGEQENLNGFADDDGCRDTLPVEVEEIRGTIEGLIYAEGETGVRDSAQRSIEKIARVMLAQSSIKIVLVGHTDDREAKAFLTPPEPGAEAPDVESVATDLARARAESVRQALIALGVPAGRFVVDGVGGEEPVADNATPKGRLANRRVELRLFVPR